MAFNSKLTKLNKKLLWYFYKLSELNVPLLNLWLEKQKFARTCNPTNFNTKNSLRNEEQILKEADSIVCGEYRIFGKLYNFKTRIPWHSDFESEFTWKKGVFFKKIIQVDLRNNADVKYPRELSRFHHLLTLGQAYLVNNDIVYYNKFKYDIQDWIVENPFMKSINWGCTQDVAIRAVNWIWGMAFFENVLDKDLEFKNIIITCLYKHGFYINQYPEKSKYNSHNHYLSDLVGLIYIGLFFKQNKLATGWLNFGIDELYREIRYQILPSGPSYERSINYNRFVTEMLFSVVILLKRNGYEIPQDILYRLEKMLEFVMYYIKPDGLAPNIGDQDDARLHPFSLINNLDHKYLLCIGAVMFKRGDFKHWAKEYFVDCDFLLGPNAKSIYDSISQDSTPLKSKPFSDAGFYIIRDSDTYMFINNSGKSKYSEIGSGTHTHSDLLSFELCIGRRTFIIDAGSYKYSGDPDKRMHFRSTKMHNTVTIDDDNQSVLIRDNLWDFHTGTLPKTNIWYESDDVVEFSGEHNGYKRLQIPVIHRRDINYNKSENTFTITDSIVGDGRHKVVAYFHFDTGISLDITRNTVRTLCEDGNNIELHFSTEKKLQITINEAFLSKSYGSEIKALVVEIEIIDVCPISLETTIKRMN